jgi:hypothetical protein
MASDTPLAGLADVVMRLRRLEEVLADDPTPASIAATERVAAEATDDRARSRDTRSPGPPDEPDGPQATTLGLAMSLGVVGAWLAEVRWGPRKGDVMVVRDLWRGADVRWIGPETVRKGVRLRPGDRAVVVDAGRYQMTSFGSLYASAGARPPRPGRGVAIRLVDGAEVTVPRQRLELPSPDHPLALEPDGTQASWWLEQLESWGRHGISVSSLVPSSFPAVCQVLHPWWGRDAEPIRWATLAEHPSVAELRDRYQTRDGLVPAVAHEQGLETSTGELDDLTASALVEVLATATTTPDDVFVAVWEGWGDVSVQRFPGAARIDTPNRGHFLLRGPLTGVLASVAASGHDQPTSGLWWPADRAWFVATEIDFEWTFVAGEPSLIDRLRGNPRLEVAPTSFDAPAGRAVERS